MNVVDYFARHLEVTRDGVAILWCWLLCTVAMFREMAHHCTEYDETHSVARARLVR